jgi:hypothetical protein
MSTLNKNGEAYGRGPLRAVSLLLAYGRILKIDKIEEALLDQLDIDVTVIDATGCNVTPVMNARPPPPCKSFTTSLRKHAAKNLREPDDACRAVA